MVVHPIPIRKIDKGSVNSQAKEIANVLQADELLARRPSQLSNGQAQCVAVARALVWNHVFA